jgi:hypothetical protein
VSGYKVHFVRGRRDDREYYQTYCGRDVHQLFDIRTHTQLSAVSCLSCLRAVVADARRAAVKTNAPLISKQLPLPFKKLY